MLFYLIVPYRTLSNVTIRCWQNRLVGKVLEKVVLIYRIRTFILKNFILKTFLKLKTFLGYLIIRFCVVPNPTQLVDN